jgi:hypothetical protein
MSTKGYLVVGQSKAEAGDDRTIPLNSSLLPVLREYAVWYREKFGETRPEWYVFSFGRPRPSDPRPAIHAARLLPFGLHYNLFCAVHGAL